MGLTSLEDLGITSVLRVHCVKENHRYYVVVPHVDAAFCKGEPNFLAAIAVVAVFVVTMIECLCM